MSAKPRRKKPSERKEFILNYLRKLNELFPSCPGSAKVDVLDSDFVDAYIDFSGVSFDKAKHGYFKCKQLSRDLTEMWQTGELSRYLKRLKPGSRNEGFPGWVYSYTL